MKTKLPGQTDTPSEAEEITTDDENFLHRWSRRKHEALKVENGPQNTVEQPIRAEETDVLPTDADMPPLDSLTEDSDYSGFLSPSVSEALRKQALRKLFHSAGVNVRDGLDDYDEDYTEFTRMGDIVTADLKHRMDKEIRQRFGESEEVPVESDLPVGQEKQEGDKQVLNDNAKSEDEQS